VPVPVLFVRRDRDVFANAPDLPDRETALEYLDDLVGLESDAVVDADVLRIDEYVFTLRSMTLSFSSGDWITYKIRNVRGRWRSDQVAPRVVVDYLMSATRRSRPRIHLTFTRLDDEDEDEDVLEFQCEEAVRIICEQFGATVDWNFL
jgi:hypothetical protein